MDLQENILKSGKELSFGKGEYLFHQNDQARGFYYILSGKVRIYRLGSDAKEVEVSLATCGDYLGEVILFSAEKFPVNALVLEDSQVVFFEKEEFLKIIDSDHQTARFMLKLLASKCLSLNERLETLNIRSPRQRLIKTLISRCSGDSKCEIKLDMKKVDLARHIGITPEALSRNIKQLQDDGLLRVDGKTVQIINCSRLKQEL